MMNTHSDKTHENKSQSMANAVSQKQSGGESTFQFIDNRPGAVAQRKLQEMANNSPQAKQATQLQAMADHYAKQKQLPIQKKASPEHSRKENNTGLPDNLKTGMENLSGMSLDDVKVHYNSDKPAQLQADAYAQGGEIHIATGQEKHLPHEAWHVVQQKQGRVKSTMQMKEGVPVNDDLGLEREADVMGGRALQMRHSEEGALELAMRNGVNGNQLPEQQQGLNSTEHTTRNHPKVIQRYVPNDLKPGEKVYIQRSTAKEFHNVQAEILRKQEANSYVVIVKGMELIARCDQLSKEPSQGAPELDIQIDELKGRSSQQLIEAATKEIADTLKINLGTFSLGGSFAVLVHAFKGGQSARTPRDIDIIVFHPETLQYLRKTYNSEKGSSSKPFNTKKKLWGIPLEIHIANEFRTELGEEEMVQGVESKETLLEKYVSRIYSLGIGIGDEAKEATSAQALLAALEKSIDENLSTKQAFVEGRVMLSKALADIRALVDAGAEYDWGKSGFNSESKGRSSEPGFQRLYKVYEDESGSTEANQEGFDDQLDMVPLIDDSASLSVLADWLAQQDEISK